MESQPKPIKKKFVELEHMPFCSRTFVFDFLVAMAIP